MKKVLFLMLFLLVLGAANVSAQVRIGGDGEPYAAAILDLNADDSNTPTENKGALALPRVNLDDNTAQLNGTEPIAGMLVYNTNASMTDGDGVGVYYWDGSQWVKPAGGSVYTGSTSVVLDGNSFQRAALSGDVTAAQNNNTLTINNGAISLAKTKLRLIKTPFYTMASTAGSNTVVDLPEGCDQNNTWYTAYCGGYCASSLNENRLYLYRVANTASIYQDTVYFWCFD